MCAFPWLDAPRSSSSSSWNQTKILSATIGVKIMRLCLSEWYLGIASLHHQHSVTNRSKFLEDFCEVFWHLLECQLNRLELLLIQMEHEILDRLQNTNSNRFKWWISRFLNDTASGIDRCSLQISPHFHCSRTNENPCTSRDPEESRVARFDCCKCAVAASSADVQWF